MKKFILTSNDIFNIKSHDLLTYYIPNHAGYKLLSLNGKEAVNFIKKNNKIDTKIIVYLQGGGPNYEFYTHIVNFLSKTKIHCYITIFTFDWWFRPLSKNHNSLMKLIFKTNNYRVITLANSVNKIYEFHNLSYMNYASNIICNNFWSCYNSSFVPFNNSPEKKILVSGATNKLHYPERNKLLNLANIVYPTVNREKHQNSKNSLYNELLNKYIACFASSVYVFNAKLQNITNTHLIILKTFEILASGALLVQPEIEVPYLEKQLGLIKGKHYLTIDFDKENIQEQIDSILEHPHINEIRKSGKDFAKENLTSEKKYLELQEMGVF